MSVLVHAADAAPAILPWVLAHAADGPSWLWLHVVRPSWISLLAFPLVVAGYELTGQRRRAGWLFLIASQGALVAIAVVDQQLGLILIAATVVWRAFGNWRRWGRPEGARA